MEGRQHVQYYSISTIVAVVIVMSIAECVLGLRLANRLIDPKSVRFRESTNSTSKMSNVIVYVP